MEGVLYQHLGSATDASHEEVHRANQYLSALIRFVTAAIDVASVDELLWLLTDEVIEELGFEDCVIYLTDNRSQRLVQRAAFGPKSHGDRQILDPIELEFGQGLVGRCAELQDTVLVNDLTCNESYIVDDAVRSAELAVPILHKGKTIGVIDSEHSRAGFFNARHVGTLNAIASIVSTKYASNNMLTALRESITELEEARTLQQALFEIAELSHQTRTLDAFYSGMHAIVSRLIPVEALRVCTLTPDGGRMMVAYCAGHPADTRVEEEVEASAFSESLAAQLVLSFEPRLLQREELQELAVRYHDVGERVLPDSWLGVPFRNDRVRGAIIVQNFESARAFNSEDRDLLVYVARQLSTAMSRRQKDEELRHQALHDELSGLPNRLLFSDRLEHALERYKRDPAHRLAVMFLDLDRFKLINDAYGHSVGDRLLREISQRIASCLRAADTLARLGGDEFAILLEQVDSDTELTQLAQRIIDTVGDPMVLDDMRLQTSASVGIAKASDDCAVADELMKLADNAMYRAKAAGKARFEFSGRDDGSFVNVLRVEQDISEALKRSEFELYLQPIVALEDTTIAGFEALIRWRHPQRGVVMPDAFIDIAEKSGQIIEIDRYMLDRAAQVLAAWSEVGGDTPYINVNVSGNSLSMPTLVETVATVVRRNGLTARSLAIEITERALIVSVDRARENLLALKALGCPIVLDDFGTGYSSLSYLQQLPIDVVKIDQSFISTVQSSHTSHSVVKTIVSLANTLDMACVAEGVELEAQEVTLLELGVALGQGYRYHRPIPAEQALTLLTH